MNNGVITNFAAAGSTDYGFSLVAGGGAHVKGTYVELFASTAFAASGFYVQLVAATAGSRNFLIDFAVGAGGAEVNIATDLALMVGDSGIAAGTVFNFTLPIASGTRISARCQCTVAGSTCLVDLFIYASDGTVQTITSLVAYGQEPATTNLVIIDPGATINTKGAYTQITASTSEAIRKIGLNVTYQNTFPTQAAWRVDIATGAGGAEVVKLGDLTYVGEPAVDTILPRSWEFDIAIASGTRIAARAACNINEATDRLIHIQVAASNGTGSSGGGSAGGAFAFA